MGVFQQFYQWILNLITNKSNGGTSNISFKSFVEFEDFINNHTDTITDWQDFKSITVQSMNIKHASCPVQMPLNIGRFQLLTTLTLHHCNINNIPWSFVYLKTLENLDLSFNCLSTVPVYIGCVSSLKVLNLEFNFLKGLPRSILQLTKLQVFKLEGNYGLIYPSYNICLRGIKAIKHCLERKPTRKNVWENCRAFYTDDDDRKTFVQSLVVLCVNCVLESKQDFLSYTNVPPILKNYLLGKQEEEKLSIIVTKCSFCDGVFSNIYFFDAHVCKY